MRSMVKVLVLTLGLGAVAAWGPPLVTAVASMETFRITAVEVTGLQYLSRESVVEQLELGQFASVWGDRDEWADRLTAHPLIRDARVERRFLPNGLRVAIQERRPVALAPTPTLEPVDGDGHRLPLDPARYAIDLPIISASRFPPENASVFPEEVRALAAALESLTRADEAFVANISMLERMDDGSVRIVLVEGDIEYIVPEDTSVGRLRDAEAAVEHAREQDLGRGPLVVDLRFADQIVVRRAR